VTSMELYMCQKINFFLLRVVNFCLCAGMLIPCSLEHVGIHQEILMDTSKIYRRD